MAQLLVHTCYLQFLPLSYFPSISCSLWTYFVTMTPTSWPRISTAWRHYTMQQGSAIKASSSTSLIMVRITVFMLPLFHESMHCHKSGADPEPPLPGGHKWPMKPKASLRREAPKGGGWGRGSPPPAGGGPGGLSRKFFEKLHQNGAFWVHFEVINTRFCTENLYEKNASH